MADILIKGLELPKEGLVEIAIDSDGNVCRYDATGYGRVAKAIKLPPHGKLRDENDLVRLIEDNYGCGVCKNKADEERCLDRCKWAVLLNDIDSLPTIVEATDGRTD